MLMSSRNTTYTTLSSMHAAMKVITAIREQMEEAKRMDKSIIMRA
jgi:hypothetical protein